MLATTTRWYRSEPVFDPIRLKRMLKHRVHIPHRALLRSFYTVKVAEAEEATSSTLISSFSLRCITKFQHAQKYGWVSWRRSRCSHTYTHTHTHSTSHWHTLTQLQVATRKITPSSSPPPPHFTASGRRGPVTLIRGLYGEYHSKHAFFFFICTQKCLIKRSDVVQICVGSSPLLSARSTRDTKLLILV